MRQIAKVLALIAGLSPAIAAAQQILPKNTVWGRLGITPSGPAQAIPFATLFAAQGGVAGPQSCSSHNWFNTLNTAGTFGCSQPAIADISGFGAGVATALGVNVGTAGSPVINGGVLGTPSSGTATNLTGLPIAGIAGLGTGVGTALAASLNATGGLVGFNGALGTPTSTVLTNATGLPISTGLSGAGTGVLAALGVNVGTAGSPVVNGGALGTPSSGIGTNLTGTAAGLTAGHVTTNANLTGDVTSVGNAATLAAGNAGNLNSGTLLAARMPALTGDVTTSAGAVATTISANAVTNAKMATMAANTVKANATGSTAVPTDVTAATARSNSLLNVDSFTGHGDSIYSILATDRTVGTNAAFTASRTWTLPAASAVNPGQEIVVADYQGTVTGTNTLVISRAGSDAINGGTSVTITAANGAYLLKSDGVSKWTAQALGSAAGGGVSSVTCFGTAITSSGTCTTAATKSDEQTGSSTTAVVTPSQQQQHDSAAKAWAFATVSGGTITIQQSYNVSGISHAAAGNYTVTFSNSFATSSGFGCVGNAQGGAGSTFNVVMGATARAGSTIGIQVGQATSFALTDPTDFFFVCYGRQ